MTRGSLLTCSFTMAVSGTGLSHPEHEFMSGLTAPSPATVLLITSSELVEAWKPFAAWKKKLGKPIRILSTKQIDERYEAKDLQEKIRRCVRNHTDHLGTRWIILGGDSESGGKGVVPDRDTAHRSPLGDYDHIPTDIYYLSKKDWDDDNDGVYGEWEDDRAAIDYPDGDVGLGRIPVRTAADVKAYTDKVIAYESKYPESKFATSMTFTCTVPDAFPKLRTSWENHISKAFPGGTLRRFYTGTGVGQALTPSNWVKLLQSGESSKIHMHGHGLHSCWILDEDERLTTEHLAVLKNTNAYPIITTVSCFTGQFDRGQDPSIAEAIIRQPGGGAVAVVAPVREGKPHFADLPRDLPLMVKEGKMDGTTRTMTQFWENGLGTKVSAGAAIMLVKAGLAKEARESPSLHLCACELNLLGDPTLSLRGIAPRTPRVSAPTELPAGNLSLVVESDAPHAIVSLVDSFGLYAVQVSDENGDVTFPLHVVKDSTITITVSGPDYNAVQLEIPVK